MLVPQGACDYWGGTQPAMSLNLDLTLVSYGHHKSDCISLLYLTDSRQCVYILCFLCCCPLHFVFSCLSISCLFLVVLAHSQLWICISGYLRASLHYDMLIYSWLVFFSLLKWQVTQYFPYHCNNMYTLKMLFTILPAGGRRICITHNQ